MEKLYFGASNSIVTKKFPLAICDCSNLKSLSISGQCFYELPPQIGNLKKLESLALSYCKIKKFPPQLLFLPNLKKLELCFLDNINDLLAQLPDFENLNELSIICDNCDFLKKEKNIQYLVNLKILSITDFSDIFAGNVQQTSPLQQIVAFLRWKLPNTKIIAL